MNNRLTGKFQIRLCFSDTDYFKILDADPLSTVDPVRTITPLKSALSTGSSDLSSVLSTAALHKRRPQKRVRFASTLEPEEEDSLPSSREISPSFMSKLKKKFMDPWPQTRPFYGGYIDYSKKQDTLTSNETQIHHSPLLPTSSEPDPPTYTHTFIIKSNSPTIVIDSITVSTPPLHLPQIIHRSKKSHKQQSLAIDSYVKQQLTLLTPPRMINRKKLSNSCNLKNHYVSIRPIPKRAELNIPSSNGLHPNNKPTRLDSSSGSKVVKDHVQTKKMTEIVPKPLPSGTNEINHFSDRSTLPNYLKKARILSRVNRANDELNLNKQSSFPNHDNDNLLQPINQLTD